MLPRSGRVGTIPTSAEEVRDRSRAAHGAFYSTISLPGLLYAIGDPGREGVNGDSQPYGVFWYTRPDTYCILICISRTWHARRDIRERLRAG